MAGSLAGQLARPPRRIAILRALYLGDLLCATPAFRALRRRFPQAEITLIGLPWARELVERSSALDRLEPFPGYPGIVEVPYEAGRTAAYLAAARAQPYDLVLQMHGDGNRSNGFVADLGPAVSLGYRRGDDDRLTASLPYDPDEHQVLRWLRLVALLGAPVDDTSLVCPTTPSDRARAAALLTAVQAARPLVGLHPGAKDPTRRLAPGVRAFAIHPGTVLTPMNEAHLANSDMLRWVPEIHVYAEAMRGKSPEPGVRLVLFLASGRADALSGRFLDAEADDVEDLVRRAAEIEGADSRLLRIAT